MFGPGKTDSAQYARLPNVAQSLRISAVITKPLRELAYADTYAVRSDIRDFRRDINLI